MPRRWMILVALAGVAAPTASAQNELDRAVEAARRAWEEHDTRGLLAASDSVRLRIPEVAAAQSLRPAQAARILAGFLAEAEELSFELREIRYVAEDHAYAELERRFVVRGTEERRDQTVFFGFRRVAGAWRLREVRVTP